MKMNEHINSNELYHYGVLGMRWGIRRGQAGSAYSKGVKKLKKLDRRANKRKTSSDKLAYKSAKVYARGRNDDKAKKLDAKARKLNYKSTKLVNSGKKFYKKMEREFSGVSMKNLNKDDIEYAKRYANRVLS